MSGPAAAVRQSGEVGESKGAPQPPSNDLQTDARDVCSKPSAKTGDKGSVDDVPRSKSPPAKMERPCADTSASLTRAGSGSGLADDNKPTPPSARRTDAPSNGAKDVGKARQAPAKTEKKGGNVKEGGPHANGKSVQDVVKTSHVEAANNVAPAGTVANPHMATTVADAVSQEHDVGGESPPKAPSSPKKKKKKKKKKKNKATNPDGTPAHAESAPGSPDKSTKQISDAVAQAATHTKSEQGQHAPKEEKELAAVSSGPSSRASRSISPSKSAKPKADAPKVEPAPAHESKKSEKPAKGQADKGTAKPTTEKPSKTGSPEPAKPGAKEKSDSKPTEPSPPSPSKKDSASPEKHANEEADDGAWETVEVKPRGRHGRGGRGGSKKSGGAQNKAPGNTNSSGNSGGRNHIDHGSNHQDSSHHSSHHGRRRKRNNKDKKNNQQQQNTKMVKEMISQILDAVDDEVVRKVAGGGTSNGNAAAKPVDNKRQPSLANRQRQSAAAGNSVQTGQQNSLGQRGRQSSNIGVAAGPPSLVRAPSMVSNASAKSMRDILVGTASTAASQNNPAVGAQGGGDAEPPAKGTSSKVKPGISYRSAIEPEKKPEPKPEPKPQPPKPKLNAWAKKPDIKASPEKKLNVEPQPPMGKSPAKRSDGLVPLCAEKATQAAKENKDKAGEASSALEDTKEEEEGASNATPSPPLSTLLQTSALLGPAAQFSCSASSSVASSLEAPHSSRFRHQSSSMMDGEDVGYHLLNVCGQLSDDINAFMKRRALALDVRRRERSAVLNALGDTLGKIWPNQCRVEMYGSCATALDLPSSDLDLVVCGLDDVVVDHTFPVGASGQTTPMSSLHLSSSLQNNSSGSFPIQSDEGGEVPQGSVASSTQQGSMPQQPMPSDQQLRDSISVAVQEGEQYSTTPEQPPRNVTEAMNESAGGLDSSPGIVDNYSADGEVGAGMEPAYSPFSYHSTQQPEMGAGGDSYHTPGSYHEEMGMVEAYQEYQTNGPNGQEQFYYAAPYYAVPSLSPNAQRVMRLASELEQQPWAVQVKAIPTATVPVVKMLADPSRLPGLAGEGANWMQMQQHLAAQQAAVVSAGGTPPPSISPEQMASAVVPNQAVPSAAAPAPSPPHFFSPTHPVMAQCWRGTDIKNGLQPVDITFEGPEHGGIGSTHYSARVVQEACDESGLPAESTPVVQVASVLKELLAQRRLNEPFSGGLSSYGLLLLLLAVLKDRKIIQEEMKKVEKQMQKVSGHGGSVKETRKQSQPTKPPQKHSGSSAKAAQSSGSSPGVDSTDKSSVAQSSVASKPTVSSSWASIAKKSGGSTARTESLSTITKSTSGSGAKTGANYSQVVQKERKGNAKDKTKESNATDSNAKLSGGRNGADKKPTLPQSSNVALDGPAVLSQVTPCSEDDVGRKQLSASAVPQNGSNDILEVLCSGELTSGKLLMHFLLFYGQHFDSQSTLIDINGTHHPDYGQVDFHRLSPFVQRPPGGNIDPVTGMYSVDPIVVYDPLEGAGDHNVSKRCYCWNNVRWVFAQAYMTLSSIVETSDDNCGAKKNHSASQIKHKKKDHEASAKQSASGHKKSVQDNRPASSTARPRALSIEDPGANAEAVTPILELFLSF